MGNICRGMKQYEKALEYYNKTYVIRERLLGPEHPKTALCYNNFALVYIKQGRYDEAMEYHMKSLDLRLKTVGPTHITTGQSYHNIGEIYSLQEKPAEALEYYLKSFEIKEKVHGKTHINVDYACGHVAEQYMKLGNYNKAIEYILRALSIRETTKKNLPGNGTSYSKLGNCYQNLAIQAKEKNQEKEYEEYIQKARESFGKIFIEKADTKICTEYAAFFTPVS